MVRTKVSLKEIKGTLADMDKAINKISSICELYRVECIPQALGESSEVEALADLGEIYASIYELSNKIKLIGDKYVEEVYAEGAEKEFKQRMSKLREDIRNLKEKESDDEAYLKKSIENSRKYSDAINVRLCNNDCTEEAIKDFIHRRIQPLSSIGDTEEIGIDGIELTVEDYINHFEDCDIYAVDSNGNQLNEVDADAIPYEVEITGNKLTMKIR